MRGEIDRQRGIFSYIDLEQRVPQDHPIRKVRRVVDKALKALDEDFSHLYLELGRSSRDAAQSAISANILFHTL